MSEWEHGPERQVDESRITLVDRQDEEYSFLILDEFEYEGKQYVAMTSCDEKADVGSGGDPGETNDITVVRTEKRDGQPMFFAITDDRELYEVAKIVEKRFGHLGAAAQERAEHIL